MPADKDDKSSEKGAGDCFSEDCESQQFLSEENEVWASEEGENRTLFSVIVAAVLAAIVMSIAAALSRW